MSTRQMDRLAASGAAVEEDIRREEASKIDAAWLSRVRETLADRERLYLAVQFADSAETEARRLVRLFSEAGFTVLKEREPDESFDGPGRLFTVQRDPHVILPYRKGDEEPILELFPRTFHVPRSLEHWRWKYADNPWGNRTISMAWTPDGTLAAHYGGYPVPFWIDGRELLGFQVGDTMTDPDVRAVGRGKNSLLGRTVKHFFAVHREGAFGFYYGFNTGPIQRFCSWFIGGSKAAEVTFRACEPSTDWAMKGYHVEQVTVPDAWMDRLFRRVAPEYGFLVKRDAKWLKWRYLDCPDENPYIVLAARRWGRLVGWSVFRKREERLVWGDALFRPKHTDAVEAILAAAIARPEFADITQVEGWFGERPAWFSGKLDGLGFERLPEPNGLGCMMLPDADPDAAARLPEMYTTMGDGDLF